MEDNRLIVDSKVIEWREVGGDDQFQATMNGESRIYTFDLTEDDSRLAITGSGEACHLARGDSSGKLQNPERSAGLLGKWHAEEEKASYCDGGLYLEFRPTGELVVSGEERGQERITGFWEFQDRSGDLPHSVMISGGALNEPATLGYRLQGDVLSMEKSPGPGGANCPYKRVRE